MSQVVATLDVDLSKIEMRSRDTEFEPANSFTPGVPGPWSTWQPVSEIDYRFDGDQANDYWLVNVVASLFTNDTCQFNYSLVTGFGGKPDRTIDFQFRLIPPATPTNQGANA